MAFYYNFKAVFDCMLNGIYGESDMESHINVVKALAEGVNPTTGEYYPDDSPYNSPVVIRALYTLLQEVEHRKGKPRGSKKTVEEKQASNVANGLPKNAGLAWQEEERESVKSMFSNGELIPSIALRLERTTGSITAELKKQGLIDY